MKKKTTYADKRKSGNMMYGPTRHIPKYPEFVSGSKKCWCNHPGHRGKTHAQCEKEIADARQMLEQQHAEKGYHAQHGARFRRSKYGKRRVA